jgi:hypothetical protein
MCSLKRVFLERYSVKYDVRLFLNASTSSIFNNFDSKIFQSLMVRGKKLGVCYECYSGCLYISEFPWVILPGCPVLLLYIIGGCLSLPDDEKLCETSIAF